MGWYDVYMKLSIGIANLIMAASNQIDDDPISLLEIALDPPEEIGDLEPGYDEGERMGIYYLINKFVADMTPDMINQLKSEINMLGDH